MKFNKKCQIFNGCDLGFTQLIHAALFLMKSSPDMNQTLESCRLVVKENQLEGLEEIKCL